MAHKPLLLELVLIAAVSACSEPTCPAPYTKYGDTCRRCPPGEEIARGKCVPVLDAAVENVTQVDAGEETPPDLDPDRGDDVRDATSEVDSTDEDTAKDAAPTAADGGQAVGAGDGSLADAARDASQPVDAGDACNLNPCQHGGRCSQSAQGASCDCAETGYTGTTCETDIDECASGNACSNAVYPCAQTEAPGYTCQGQFADWPMPDAVVSSKVKPSYDTTSVADVVVDNVTGLAWQKVPPPEAQSWADAKAYCQNLAVGGSSDWRLPTKVELESIVDDTQTNPSINRDAFPGVMGGAFLTASPVAGGAAAVPWLVEFGRGLTWPLEMSGALGNVRCVRTARRPSGAPAGRYTFGSSAGRATVTDKRTGLVWERDLYPTQFVWSEARARCASFGVPWRLPTKKELLTLVDVTIDIATPPVIDLDAFPGTPRTVRFWSATGTSSTDTVWVLGANGSVGMLGVMEKGHVRCVQ